MSPVAFVLDLLLAALLSAALIVGLRLNSRLKALREGETNFAKAVVDLNAAAERAEAGLATLRAATEEGHDALLTRIETARALCAKLDGATAHAAKVGGAEASGQLSPNKADAGLTHLAQLAAAFEQSAAKPFRSAPTRRDRPDIRREPPRFDDDLFENGDDGGGEPDASHAFDPPRPKGDLS